MEERYFLITTDNPRIVRYSNGITEVFDVTLGWVERGTWFERIFFSDFTDYQEITKETAETFMKGLSVA